MFPLSSINVSTKNNVWVQNVALNLVLVQENQIKTFWHQIWEIFVNKNAIKSKN